MFGHWRCKHGSERSPGLQIGFSLTGYWHPKRRDVGKVCREARSRGLYTHSTCVPRLIITDISFQQPLQDQPATSINSSNIIEFDLVIEDVKNPLKWNGHSYSLPTIFVNDMVNSIGIVETLQGNSHSGESCLTRHMYPRQDHSITGVVASVFTNYGRQLPHRA